MGEHERDREGKGEKDKNRRVGASSILHEYSISRAGVISQAAYSLSKLSRRPTQPSITIRERNFASSFSLSLSQFRHVRENPDYVYYTRIFSPRLSMCYVAVNCCSACFSLLSFSSFASSITHTHLEIRNPFSSRYICREVLRFPEFGFSSRHKERYVYYLFIRHLSIARVTFLFADESYIPITVRRNRMADEASTRFLNLH